MSAKPQGDVNSGKQIILRNGEVYRIYKYRKEDIE